MLPLTAGTDYAASQTLMDVRLIGVTSINAFAYAFVLLKLQDNNTQAVTVQLSAAICNQGVWQTTWANLGQPSAGISFDGTYQGTVVSAGTAMAVFVCGGDGQLWTRWWTGAWAPWQSCPSVAGGPTAIAKVDHVAGQFVYVVDSANQPWVMAINPFGQWVATKQPATVIAGNTDVPQALIMGGGYYCAMTISNKSLYPRLYLDAGVASSRYVSISYDPTIEDRYQGHANVCVHGWNPSTPTVIRMSGWQPLPTKGFVTLDLSTMGLEDGSVCWVQIDGNGTAKASARVSKALVKIDSDSSAANFNYRPNMPTLPGGSNVAYTVQDKAYTYPLGHFYWGFSGCSNTP